MLKELGISAGTAIIILFASYYIIKWAVKNAIKDAYEDINGITDKKEIDVIKQMINSSIQSNNEKTAESQLKNATKVLRNGNKEKSAEELEKWYKETIKNKKNDEEFAEYIKEKTNDEEFTKFVKKSLDDSNSLENNKKLINIKIEKEKKQDIFK